MYEYRPQDQAGGPHLLLSLEGIKKAGHQERPTLIPIILVNNN